MLVVTGLVEVAEASVEPVKALAATMAAETRKESGCRAYAFYQDIEQPTRFRIYEEWEDQAALSAHFQTAHMAAFNAGLGAVEIRSIDVKKFEPGPMSAVP